MNKVNKLVVVGMRELLLYGYESLKFILYFLLEREWFIVSGFVKGIDIMFYEIIVRYYCLIIVILGYGLFFMYLKENRYLYEMWKEYILLLIEYLLYYVLKKWYFLKRNWIISGISKGVLVVEVKLRSGIFIIVDFVLE